MSDPTSPTSSATPTAKRQYFITTATIHNPAGDKRSNRAGWRSPLKQSKIPEGFIWYLMDSSANNRHDVICDGVDNETVMVSVHVTGSIALLTALRSLSVPTEETVDTVLNDYRWRTEVIVKILCKAKGITPAELREVLEADVQRDKETP